MMIVIVMTWMVSLGVHGDMLILLVMVFLCCFVSYKEESDDVTDSDDLLEIEAPEVDQEKETAETIEKVIKRRVGRKGGKYPAIFNSVYSFLLSLLQSSPMASAALKSDGMSMVFLGLRLFSPTIFHQKRLPTFCASQILFSIISLKGKIKLIRH